MVRFGQAQQVTVPSDLETSIQIPPRRFGGSPELQQKALIEQQRRERLRKSPSRLQVETNIQETKQKITQLEKKEQYLKTGIAVVQFAKTDAMFNSDVWHTKINEKIETGYFNRRKMGKRAKAPYPKLVNFSGYIRFGKLQLKSEELYQGIKDAKRREIRLLNNTDDKRKPVVNFYDTALEELQKKRFDKESFMSLCQVNGIKYLPMFSSSFTTKF